MTTTTTTTTTLLENNNNFNEQQDKIFVLHNTMYFQVNQNQHFHVMIFSAVGEGGKTFFYAVIIKIYRRIHLFRRIEYDMIGASFEF